MHPEVVSDKPGNCPKCGMKLVLESEVSKSAHHMDTGLETKSWKNYLPLAIIILMITAVALVTSWNSKPFTPDFVIHFMTGFFLVFSGFKLLDLKGFAEGYSRYDLLAQKVFGYGYVYPFIELAFGFLMLSGFHPDWLLVLEAIVMIFSGIGVAIKIAQRKPFMCSCLGTFLKVPLTYITLIEDFGMALLALGLLFIK